MLAGARCGAVGRSARCRRSPAHRPRCARSPRRRRCAVDEHVAASADLARKPRGADRCLHRHEARAALFLHVAREPDRAARWPPRRRPANRRSSRRGRAAPRRRNVEQLLELGFGLAGKADDERAAHRDVGTRGAPRARCARALFSAFGRALHQLEDARARVLERHVEIRQQAAPRGRRAISGMTSSTCGYG